MKYIKRKNLLKLFQPSLPAREVLAQELEKLGDTGKQVLQEIDRLKKKNNNLKNKINRLKSKDLLNTLILSCVISIIFSVGSLVT